MKDETKPPKRKPKHPWQDEKGRIKPGHTGNPNGFQGNSSAVRMMRKQLHAGMPGVVEQVRRRAMDGDMGAAGIYLRAAVPPGKAEPTMYDLTPIGLAQTPREKALASMQMVEQGELPIDEGIKLATLYMAVYKDDVIPELAARLDAIESMNNG